MYPIEVQGQEQSCPIVAVQNEDGGISVNCCCTYMTYEPQSQPFTPIQVHYKFLKQVYYYQIYLTYLVVCLNNIYYREELAVEYYSSPLNNGCDQFIRTGGGTYLILDLIPKGNCFATARIRYKNTQNSPLDSCGFSTLNFEWHGNGYECY
ncbi:MAG TPA: hypothetical protein PK006_13550 [Saprospiraceae bacterium]|nr:hypothetical protein [Saprospiraceae bacterium]